MKTIPFLLLCLIIYCPLESLTQNFPVRYRPYTGTNAQGQHTYGSGENFPMIQVSEDFGPRQLGSDVYDWHGGIDYNSGEGDTDFGDLILAVEGGTVNKHGPNQTGTKWITIEGSQSFNYVHIFVGGAIPTGGMLTGGGCVLIQMDAPNANSWAIVFMVNGQYHAIGPPTVETGEVTFMDEADLEHTLLVSTTVNQGSPVAPLGTSDNFTAHLHLGILTQLENASGSVIFPWNDTYAKNPLEHVAYDDADISVMLLKQDDITPGITLNYPGTSNSTLQARVSIAASSPTAKRYETLMDIEQVDFLIKKNYQSTYSPIVGAAYDKIRLGGWTDNTPIPEFIINSAGLAGIQNMGSWSRTGMQPFAYSEHPYDDYYFADFFTRIHMSDPMNGASSVQYSYCPMSSRYNDGRYQVKAHASDGNGGYASSPISNLTIDNYKPFIREVKAEVNNQVIYRRTWQCDDGANCQGMRLTQLQTVPDILKLTAHLPLSSNLPIPTGVILVCKP